MSELERELRALSESARFPATPDAAELLGRALERSGRPRRARTTELARRAALASSVCLAIAASSLLATSSSTWPFGSGTTVTRAIAQDVGPGTTAGSTGVELVRAWKLAALEPGLGPVLGDLLAAAAPLHAGPCRRHGPLSACA